LKQNKTKKQNNADPMYLPAPKKPRGAFPFLSA
jgi:hypothetical protein